VSEADTSPPSQNLLGEFSARTFLSDFYQKRPLFLRQALPGFTSPLSAEELAGLACEESVESRLIENTYPGSPTNPSPWNLSHGPFSESDFESLDIDNWTLLIQDADKHVPAVEKLLSLVRFLPSWSVDDIMISFAPPGGNVGPHTDQYDVFLVQAQGTRRWELSEKAEHGPNRTDTDLRVLSRFKPETTHIATPGDVLYIPPNVAHYGVAEDDCITLSFGFRAPSNADLLEAYLGDALEAADHALLREERTRPPRHPAELSPQLIEEVASRLQRSLTASAREPHWLGRYLSARKPHLPPIDPLPGLTPIEFRDALSTLSLERTLGTRYLFAQNGPEVTLYVDGEAHPLREIPRALDFAHLLTEAETLVPEELAPFLPECVPLLKTLVDESLLAFCSNDERSATP